MPAKKKSRRLRQSFAQDVCNPFQAEISLAPPHRADILSIVPRGRRKRLPMTPETATLIREIQLSVRWLKKRLRVELDGVAATLIHQVSLVPDETETLSRNASRNKPRRRGKLRFVRFVVRRGTKAKQAGGAFFRESPTGLQIRVKTWGISSGSMARNLESMPAAFRRSPPVAGRRTVPRTVARIRRAMVALNGWSSLPFRQHSSMEKSRVDDRNGKVSFLLREARLSGLN